MTDFLTLLVKHDVWSVIVENIGLKDSQSIVFSLSLLSKFFNNWSHLSLQGVLFDDSTFQISEDALKTILTKCPNLKSIELMMCLDLTPESFKRILSTPSLISLRIFNCSQLTSASMLQSFENCLNLQEIEFYGFKIGYQSKSIFYYLSLCPKLKTLILKRNEFLTDDIAMMKNLKELQYEFVDRTRISLPKQRFSFPEGLTNLQTLCLDLRFFYSAVTLSFENLVNLHSLEVRSRRKEFILEGSISPTLRFLKSEYYFLNIFSLINLSKHLDTLQVDIFESEILSRDYYSEASWKLFAQEIANEFRGIPSDCSMNILIHTHFLLQGYSQKSYTTIQNSWREEFKLVVPSCKILFNLSFNPDY